MRRVLAIRDARVYLAGQSLSLLGDTSMWLALSMWAKDLTGSSSAAGLTIFCIVAVQLLSPLSGLLVDRVRRRRLLLTVNLLTAAAVLPLLAVHDRGDAWILYAVALAYGLSYTLLAAGQSALLTTMLPPDLLGEANAVLQTVREGLRLIAPLAGAGLYATAGGGAVALLDAATFLLAAVTLAAMRSPDPKPRAAQTAWRTAVAAGLRHLTAVAELRRIALAGGMAALVFGFGETIVYEVVQNGLGRPVSFVGVMSAAQGVGAVAGAVTATRAMRAIGEARTAGLGMAILAAGALAQAASGAALILPGKALFGLGLPWLLVGLATLLQRLTPPGLQGRAYAALELMMSGPQTLSIALGAALVAVVDYRLLLIAEAATMAAGGALLLIRRPAPRAVPAPAH